MKRFKSVSLENLISAQHVIDSRQVQEHTDCGTDSGSPYPLPRIAGFASDHVVGMCKSPGHLWGNTQVRVQDDLINSFVSQGNGLQSSIAQLDDVRLVG